MLKARNLDDQTYEEIVQAAEGRLPWLCPAWTDHNAHDPGITVLELMAWYKELQQYQMNQFTGRAEMEAAQAGGDIPPAGGAGGLCGGAGAGRPRPAPLCPADQPGGDPPPPLSWPRACPPGGRRWPGSVWPGRMGWPTWGSCWADARLPSAPSAGPGGGPLRACGSDSPGWGEGALRLWFEVVPPDGVPAQPLCLSRPGPPCAPLELRGGGGYGGAAGRHPRPERQRLCGSPAGGRMARRGRTACTG